ASVTPRSSSAASLAPMYRPVASMRITASISRVSAMDSGQTDQLSRGNDPSTVHPGISVITPILIASHLTRPPPSADCHGLICRLYLIGQTAPHRLHTMSRSAAGGAAGVDARANHLLRGLSEEEFDRIGLALEPVRLPRSAEPEGTNEA